MRLQRGESNMNKKKKEQYRTMELRADSCPFSENNAKAWINDYVIMLRLTFSFPFLDNSADSCDRVLLLPGSFV
jgi:hypothetical protein